jgi:hypothetical protein
VNARTPRISVQEPALPPSPGVPVREGTPMLKVVSSGGHRPGPTVGRNHRRLAGQSRLTGTPARHLVISATPLRSPATTSPTRYRRVCPAQTDGDLGDPDPGVCVVAHRRHCCGDLADPAALESPRRKPHDIILDIALWAVSIRHCGWTHLPRAQRPLATRPSAERCSPAHCHWRSRIRPATL